MTVQIIPNDLCSPKAHYQRQRADIIKRYNLNCHNPAWGFRTLTCAMIDQLNACKDESARRILLGVTRKRTQKAGRA